MEKDRALNLLQNGLLPQVHGAYHDALEAAIKALEQEPCEDAISRQAVLDEIETVYLSRYWSGFGVDYGGNGIRNYIINYIKQLQPIQPEQKWILVSERLPEEYGEYLITWTTSRNTYPHKASR